MCEYSPPQEQVLDGGCYVTRRWVPGENPGDIWGTAIAKNLPEAVPMGTRPGPADPGLWVAPPL